MEDRLPMHTGARDRAPVRFSRAENDIFVGCVVNFDPNEQLATDYAHPWSAFDSRRVVRTPKDGNSVTHSQLVGDVADLFPRQ